MIWLQLLKKSNVVQREHLRFVEILFKIKCLYKNGIVFQFGTSTVLRTYITKNLGDNIFHLLFLSKLAAEFPDRLFIHYLQNHYIPQIEFYCSRYKNIKFLPLDHVPFGACNAWKNHKMLWAENVHRNDFYRFYVDFFKSLSLKLTNRKVEFSRDDLNFEWQELQLAQRTKFPAYEFLIINSRPMSGQITEGLDSLDHFARKLSEHHLVITTHRVNGVDCTNEIAPTLRDIANLAYGAARIVTVATGPMWFALNNSRKMMLKPVFVLCEKETIEYSANTLMFRTVADLIKRLEEDFDVQTMKT